MNKQLPNRPRLTRIRKYLLLITYAIVLLVLLYRIDAVWKIAVGFLSVFSPLLVGFVIAYVLHVPMLFIQYKLFGRMRGKTGRREALWRGLSLLVTYLLVLGALTGIGALIVPRVAESVTQLAMNFSGYLSRFQTWADGVLSSLSIHPEIGETVADLWRQAIQFLQEILGKAVNSVLNFTVHLTAGVYQLLLSFMLAGFMLYNREKLLCQFRRLWTAIFGAKQTRRTARVLRVANVVFSRFIVGQVTEAVILGTLCFIGMSLLGMNYPLLISVIIGVTALIPILGSLIGTVPCALILLVIEPMQAVWFLVFIVILQQLENNLIYPHVVGNAVGLPGLWVLSSVIVGGALFGVWGMALATPCAAVIYRLTGEWVHGREEAQGPPECE